MEDFTELTSQGIALDGQKGVLQTQNKEKNPLQRLLPPDFHERENEREIDAQSRIISPLEDRINIQKRETVNTYGKAYDDFERAFFKLTVAIQEENGVIHSIARIRAYHIFNEVQRNIFPPGFQKEKKLYY